MRFDAEEDLRKFLEDLGDLYPQYSARLWSEGPIRSTEELAVAPDAGLQRCGVLSDIHIARIKAAASGAASTRGQAGAAAAAGPTPHPTSAERTRVNALVRLFAQNLYERLKALPDKVAKRSGCITGVSTGAGATVLNIGQHFALQGLEASVKQLFQLMYNMDQVHKGSEHVLKPELHPPLLKLVAAPGMGKTTALSHLWVELYKYLETHKDVICSVLEKEESLLHDRVFNSLQPHQPLVFTLDLRGDLRELAFQELRLLESLQPRYQGVLAMRMLLSTLRDDATRLDLEWLLATLEEHNLLATLEPLDVLQFVQAAMQLQDKQSMAVFAFDEVNAVKPPTGAKASWLQHALSAFVQLSVEAGRRKLKMMPVAMIASTLASATSLQQTYNGVSTVAEVQLLPLSYIDMKYILVDVCKRVGQPWGDGDDLDKHVKQLLKLTFGVPRFLAWAIHCLSDDPRNVYDQNLKLAGEDQEPCPWLRNLQRPLHDIVGRLTDEARLGTSTAAWLVDVGKAEALAQILAHAVLERKVVRSAQVTPQLSWQDVENAGLCTLLHAGAMIPVSSPAGSPHNSGGGSSQASGTNQPPPLSSSDVKALTENASRQRTAASDISSEYVVFLCPLLAIAAMNGLQVGGSLLSVLPLVRHLADDLRMREYTDLAVFILRLELARAVLGLTEMSLRELLPSAAQLPVDFQDLQILVPPPRSGRPYEQKGPFKTADEFVQHCKPSDGSSYAYIGGGSDVGPDSWLVLRAVGGGHVVVSVQSKKRQGRVGQVGAAALDAEAKKCWGAGTNLKRLLVYVTDEDTNKVTSPYTAKEAGLSVVVVGRSQQDSFYSRAAALTKRLLEWDVQCEKQSKKAR